MRELFYIISSYLTKKINIASIKLVVLIPIFLFIYNLNKLAYNFPIGDDYYAILHFMNLYVKTDSIKEKLILLFSLHAEHQIIICKIITIFNYYLLSIINFKYLIYFGNLFLLGIIYISYKSFNIPDKNKFLYFIPVFFILLNFSFGESIIWAMASLTNFTVLFFSLLTYYIFNNSQVCRLPLTLFFATIATFSFGNGFLVFLPIILQLIFSKKYFLSFLLFIYFLILLKFYYSNGSLLESNRDEIKIDFNYFKNSILFLFVFLGSIFQNFYISLTYGLFLVIFFIFISYKKYYRINPINYSIMLFLFLSATITSVTRSSFGIEYGLASRYAFYSSIVSFFSYLISFELFFNQNFKKAKYFFKIFILLVIPISIVGFFLFPIKTKYQFTINTLPYIYYIQKKSNLEKEIYLNTLNIYRINSKNITNTYFIKSLPYINSKINQKLQKRYLIFQSINFNEGNILEDTKILKKSNKLNIYKNDF